MQKRTPIGSFRLLPIIGCLVISLVTVWAVAAPPTKITAEVASTEDLTAEVHSLLTSIESALSSEESYNDRRDSLKRQAIQVAILAQALTDHDTSSSLKKCAPGLRNAALVLGRAKSLDEAGPAFSRVKEALEGKLSGTPAVEAEWGKLAPASALMPAMKERTESIRKALRRPRDPSIESRHAMAVALMILAIHDNTQTVKNPADRSAWQATCLELQGEMSQTAAAIRNKDTSSAAEHFRLGMEACDRCHQKFKP